MGSLILVTFCNGGSAIVPLDSATTLPPACPIAAVNGVLLSAAIFHASHGYGGVFAPLSAKSYQLLFGLLHWRRKGLRRGLMANARPDTSSGVISRILK